MLLKLNSKLELAKELRTYDKVKNEEQVKALVDFLEYLFLIKDKFLEEKFEDYKKSKGGVYKMTVEEVRKLYYEGKGIEKGIEKGLKRGRVEGIEEGKINLLVNLLNVKFKEVPNNYKEKIEKSSNEVLDKIGENIFELNKIEDLDKFLN